MASVSPPAVNPSVGAAVVDGPVASDTRTLEGPLDTDDFAPVRALPPHDMVIAYHALETPDWRPYLRALGRLARKILVLTTCNPHNWGVTIVRAEGRTGRLGALAAHLHAFVVDTAPRTPQARRRLEQLPPR